MNWLDNLLLPFKKAKHVNLVQETHTSQTHWYNHELYVVVVVVVVVVIVVVVVVIIIVVVISVYIITSNSYIINYTHMLLLIKWQQRILFYHITDTLFLLTQTMMKTTFI